MIHEARMCIDAPSDAHVQQYTAVGSDESHEGNVPPERLIPSDDEPYVNLIEEQHFYQKSCPLIALHSMFPWPHGVKTMPEVDQEIGGTKPVEFERDKRALEALIEQFAHAQVPICSPTLYLVVCPTRSGSAGVICIWIIICVSSANNGNLWRIWVDPLRISPSPIRSSGSRT